MRQVRHVYRQRHEEAATVSRAALKRKQRAGCNRIGIARTLERLLAHPSVIEVETVYRRVHILCGGEQDGVVLALLRRGAQGAFGVDALDPIAGHPVECSLPFESSTLLCRHARNPGHPEDSALTTQQLLGEFFELSATDMVRRIEQRTQSGDLAKICVYAELKRESVPASLRAELQLREFALTMRDREPRQTRRYRSKNRGRETEPRIKGTRPALAQTLRKPESYAAIKAHFQTADGSYHIAGGPDLKEHDHHP